MPDIQTGIAAVFFTQICHPAHQFFAYHFWYCFLIFQHSLPPATSQIIPLPVSVNMNIVCDVQGPLHVKPNPNSDVHGWNPSGSTEATRLKSSFVFSPSLLNVPSSRWAASMGSGWILIPMGSNHLCKQGKFGSRFRLSRSLLGDGDEEVVEMLTVL